MAIPRTVTLFVASLALLGAGLTAQCQLQPLPPRLASASRPIHSSLYWDPDGPGPATARVVLGGDRGTIGTQTNQAIAAFDPGASTWSAIGSGLVYLANPAETSVRALATRPNGDLIAAGRFTNAGIVATQYIARWDGTTWAALGSGVTWTPTPSSSDIHALAVLPNGDVVAAGLFDLAGGTPVRSIARWDGAAWHDMDGGLNFGPGLNISAEVRSLLVLPNGDLLVGGNFTHAGTVATTGIARWNGSWSAVPSLGSRATTLALRSNGDVVACWANLTSGSLQVFDGTTWTSLGSLATSGGAPPYVGSLIERANGDIVATGNFVSIGGVAVNRTARWDGTSWSAMGTGMTPWMQNAPQGQTLLETTDGSLWLGGNFQAIGGTGGTHLAIWGGSTWSSNDPFSVNNLVTRLVADGVSGLLVGGRFTSADTTSANRIAVWSGSAWQPLGSGVAHSSPFVPAEVRAMVRRPDGSIVAGGFFDTAGGVPAPNIARWDGSAWAAMGNLGGSVTELIQLPNGDLIAGGAFGGTPGAQLWNIARWTGSAWAPLGSNTTNQVTAMTAMPDGSLVAAFQIYGPLRWDGSNWSDLGAPWPIGNMLASVAVLADGDLVAGGTFQFAGGGVPALNIARWNGTSWAAMGAGIPSSVLRVVALPDGSALAFAANGSVLRWNGLTWVPQTDATTGLNGVTTAAALLPSGSIVVGGSFTISGVGVRRLATLRSTCPASAAVVPSACVRPGGPLTTTTPVLPWTGGTMTTTVQPLTATSIGLVATGFAATQVPLSLLDPSAGVNCDLLTTPDVIQVAAIGNGVGTTLLAIPPSPLLVGAVLRQQAVELEVGPSSLTGVYASNALTLTIGAYN